MLEVGGKLDRRAALILEGIIRGHALCAGVVGRLEIGAGLGADGVVDRRVGRAAEIQRVGVGLVLPLDEVGRAAVGHDRRKPVGPARAGQQRGQPAHRVADEIDARRVHVVVRLHVVDDVEDVPLRGARPHRAPADRAEARLVGDGIEVVVRLPHLAVIIRGGQEPAARIRGLIIIEHDLQAVAAEAVRGDQKRRGRRGIIPARLHDVRPRALAAVVRPVVEVAARDRRLPVARAGQRRAGQLDLHAAQAPALVADRGVERDRDHVPAVVEDRRVGDGPRLLRVVEAAAARLVAGPPRGAADLRAVDIDRAAIGPLRAAAELVAHQPGRGDRPRPVEPDLLLHGVGVAGAAGEELRPDGQTGDDGGGRRAGGRGGRGRAPGRAAEQREDDPGQQPQRQPGAPRPAPRGSRPGNKEKIGARADRCVSHMGALSSAGQGRHRAEKPV
ncbi:MAG: hypothetical protein BWY52_03241 [Chloroflexi bacterium ADurb.Bin325]|nr:MAG: hypothetical protein BWY52_03241 [Chloroflexi bacterium ADurb.Bin325]